MIYLVYVASEAGVPIWRYHNPLMPTTIIKSIVGKDESIITGYATALAELTKKVFGDRVQRMESETYTLYHGYYELDRHRLLLLILSDVNDSEKAVWRVITKFIEENKVGFLKLIEYCGYGEEIGKKVKESGKSEADIERECQVVYRKLERALHEELDKSLRMFRPLMYRNKRTMFFGSIISFLVFLAMFFVTQYANTQFRWLSNNQLGPLFTTITILDYIIPSIVLGLVIGYRKGAFYSGFFLGMLITLFLIGYHISYLLAWINQWNLSPYIYFMLPVLIIALGGAIGVISSYIAGYFIEDKTLVPAEEEKEFKEKL